MLNRTYMCTSVARVRADTRRCRPSVYSPTRLFFVASRNGVVSPLPRPEIIGLGEGGGTGGQGGTKFCTEQIPNDLPSREELYLKSDVFARYHVANCTLELSVNASRSVNRSYNTIVLSRVTHHCDGQLEPVAVIKKNAV